MTAPVMASCAPVKRRTQAPPTKKRAKSHGNAGRACSRSDFRQLAPHVAKCSAERPRIQRRYTILPATIVAIGAPRKVRPSNGVLRERLGESDVRYVHV